MDPVIPRLFRATPSSVFAGGRPLRAVPTRCPVNTSRYLCQHLEPRLLLAANALYPALTLDPADRLMNSRVLGDWNGATSDGWQVNNVATWTAAGGALTLTSQN